MAGGDHPSGPSQFRTTAWSVVAGAQEEEGEDRATCLAFLCRNYWKPVYYYIRRRGLKHDDALDLAQEYFAHFLEKNFVKNADRERGRFRTFVLVTLHRFLQKQLVRRRRQALPLSVVLPHTEGFADESLPDLAEDQTPEDDFNRRWALSLLEATMDRMRETCAEGRQAEYCRVFTAYIEGMSLERAKSYRQIGEELGLSETDVTNYLHRGRNIFQNLLRQEIRQSVTSEAEIDTEIAALKQYLIR